jgi:hypothetical protein
MRKEFSNLKKSKPCILKKIKKNIQIHDKNARFNKQWLIKIKQGE